MTWSHSQKVHPDFLLLSNLPLSEGFGDLTSLEDLNMQYCTSVVSLPASFCRLSNLKKLNLDAVFISQPMKLESLPERFGQLTSLQTLYLSSCESLKELPAGAPAHILPPCSASAVAA